MPNIIPSATPRQMDLFYADTRFFMILNSLITSGQAAELGANAILIYCILKVNADYDSGLCSVGLRHISKHSGIKNFQTINKGLRKLEEFKLIEKMNGGKGTRNMFKVSDSVAIYDDPSKAKEVGRAFIPYEANKLREHINDLRSALRTGETPRNSSITINLVINTGNNNTNNTTFNTLNSSDNSINATANLDDLPVEVKSFLQRMMNKGK